MCAIFGWLDYKSIINSKVLNKLTQALANAAEERGTDAAGISYVCDKKVVVYKRPRPAHKIKFIVPKGVSAVMGHTRFATQGDKKHNQNNHPFKGRANVSFALAHNGVLYNDTQLRKSYGLPDTNIETDSYIAVQLIENYKYLTIRNLKLMAEDVYGTYNFTILDEFNNLYFVKGSNPLQILHFEALGLYVYASTETIIKKALNKSILKNFAYKNIVLTEGDILKLDRYGHRENGTFEPKELMLNKKFYNDWFYYDYAAESTESKELNHLYNYGRFYGIDEDEIDELLEFGFTSDDIQELFYNTAELKRIQAMIRGELDD